MQVRAFGFFMIGGHNAITVRQVYEPFLARAVKHGNISGTGHLFMDEPADDRFCHGTGAIKAYF
ncbi:hypothetical protein D3C76_1764360 [compost metagenome]